ncbi:TcdA/TcdB pore-forming domain-containing protein [Pseudomonas sp. A-RE-19]|uniref:TcdA/TcdB pore-forming domain-containing protein n=1 Tax=Pseudomonas sp. A-RE-19 TaxID=2832401 RepID=UPI001CBE7F38|nr:TcdA/TcdB pore-forming domain-containing protein [Pseudomonas sp. A-RE-19]
MNSKTPVTLGQVDSFSRLFERGELESALNGFEAMPEHDAALRYYEGAAQASSLQARLTPVSLLKETLELINPKGSSASLQTVQDKLADYFRRLNTTVELLGTAKPVPKKLHFVWVGGGIGAIQGDYINVWKQLLAPEGYSLNLWYDSDALLAHETHRIIVESAKALGMQGTVDTAAALARRYIERTRVLRQQMFDHIQSVTRAGGSADQARIDLLVSAYGQDEVALKALKARNLQSLEGVGVARRDIRVELFDQPLFDIYEREISFRTNLAAASDITRLQAVNIESGTYLDTDLLPSLHKKLGDVDLAGFGAEERIGVMQILLDHNPEILPNRGRAYADFRPDVPEQYKEALAAFARSMPSLRDIFAPFDDVMVASNGLRVGNKNTPDLLADQIKTPFNGLSNALLSGHAGSAQLAAIMEKIRGNYQFRDRVVAQALSRHVSLQDRQAFSDLIIHEMEKQYGPISGWTANVQSLNSFLQAINDYDADGIKFGAQSAIGMSGPTAVSSGLSDFANNHTILEARQLISDQVDLFDGFNLATEEETHHSWKDSAKSEQNWFDLETEKSRQGGYKSHYKGNIDELLKGQLLTFEKGWPVIEGRPVLLTDVLQRLLDDLGAPLIRAMNEKLSGDLSFDRPWSLSFDERQRILAQGNVDLPVAHGFEPIGNLNEMIVRIGHGSLPLDQLSPVHRVLLGGLFGAQTLDNIGFEGAWQHIRTLAESTADRGFSQRYIAIEQALLSRRHPAFEAGAASARMPAEPSKQNAQVLKALAFETPLTLRQWGEHIARIKYQAQYELRHLIFERSATVLETFIAQGASSGRLMPQGLLIRGEGDPGRRCYPLVLAMAAALEKGPSAVDALSGRLATANLSPDDNETHAFLATLDELRTVPMARSGTLLGTSRLDLVMQTLKARASTSTLMLNTESHSLLVAKIVNGASSAYRFYDPNFGVFGFEQAQALHRGLEQFLSSPELSRLYGISHLMDATFNVVDLNGPRIADQPLASHHTVAGLLSHDPISAGVAVTPWEHHAALRARSLSENARLGRGLSELDARYWAQQIQHSTARLHTESNLGRDFAPVFDSVRKMPGGQYEISLVSLKDPARTIRVSSTDSVLSRIRSYLTETFQTLSVKPSVPGRVDPTEVSAVHTLNAAFTVQALLMALKSHEQLNDINADRSLTTAVQMHGYLSYAQLAHGNLVDVVELVKLFQVALSDASLVARTTSSVVVNALGHLARDGLGTVLQLATLGFDIYLLSNAKDDLQQAQYGTQLAFDSAGLALSVAGVGAGLAGATTTAAFLGGAGVILGGLAIGVGALVEGFNGTLERGRRIGQYLNRVNKAYRTGGHSIKEGVFYANPYAHIREIDLRKKRITFDSQEILSANTYTLNPPDLNPDRSKAINIRQHLGLAEHAPIADPTIFQAIVLPCVAKTWFGFDYSALPFSTTRSEYFETALKLEYDAAGSRRFWFTFYKFPSEYILHNLYPVEVQTTISILLDEAPRSLLVPELPKILHGKLSYSIEGLGGPCALTLDPGVRLVSLSQAEESRPMAWTLHALWLSEMDIVVGEGQLKLGAVDVQVMGTPELIIQTSHNSFRVDWTQRQLLLEELETDPTVDTAIIQTRVRELARTHRLASPFTAVQHFPVPFADPQEPQQTTAFYEQAHDRFIYARDLPSALANQARLGTVMGGQAYFYSPRESLVWRSDVVTGQVNRFYRLMDPVPGSTISVFQDLGHGVIRIVQQVTQRTGREAEVIYLLGENEVKLMAIAGRLTGRQRSLLLKDVMEAWSDFFWDYELLVQDEKLWPLTQVKVVDYKPAAFVSITPLTEDKEDPVSTWVRDADGLVIRPDMSQAEGPDGAVSPLLLTPATSAGDTFLLYDKRNSTLYRQKIGAAITGVDAQAERIDPRGVIEVIANEGRYVALTRQGLYFDIDDQGQSQLTAITEDWLEEARAPLGSRFEWWTEVGAVARNYQALSFAILGLGSGVGEAKLCAWYTDHRWLMADLGPEKQVRLVATTRDDQAGWLLDVSAGQLYRQAFLEPEQLPTLFANGLRLLRQGLLPAPQKVWSQWSFAHVWAHETGLRGRTFEGVELEMRFGEPARIVGVTGDWVLAKQGTNDPYDAGVRHALKALVSEHPHEAFISVGGYSGYQWYVADIDQVVGEVNTGLETRLLGVRNKKTALLHEVPSQVTYSASRDVWLENSVARREAEVLLLEFQGELKDLMPLIPDDVSQVILSYGPGANSCNVSSAVWQRLECIVVDCRRLLGAESWVPGQLMLVTGIQDGWRASLVEGQLLLTDPDTGHSLVIRNVHAEDSAPLYPLTLNLQILDGTIEVALDELVQAMDADEKDGVELRTLVEQLNEV